MLWFLRARSHNAFFCIFDKFAPQRSVHHSLQIVQQLILQVNKITFSKLYVKFWTLNSNMEASKPKRVNPNDIQYRDNSLRLGGLHIIYKIPLSQQLYKFIQIISSHVLTM